MKTVCTVSILSLAIVSCSARQTFDPTRFVEITSPRGYKMTFVDNGTIATGFMTKDRLGQLLDDAIVGAVNHMARYGIPEVETRSAIQKYLILGYDHGQFQTANSPTGWASGMLNPDTKRLYVALYNRHQLNPADPWPDDAPEWCRMENPPNYPGKKLACTLRPGEIPFPALGHEIGHDGFGGRYGTDVFGVYFEHWPAGDPRYR